MIISRVTLTPNFLTGTVPWTLSPSPTLKLQGEAPKSVTKYTTGLCIWVGAVTIAMKTAMFHIRGVVKVDFLRIFQNSTNFNVPYLRAPEELDKKKPHFRTFQEQLFPTPCWSTSTDVSRKSYSRLKTVTKCKKSIRYGVRLTIRPPQRAKRGCEKVKKFCFDCLEKTRNIENLSFGI